MSSQLCCARNGTFEQVIYWLSRAELGTLYTRDTIRRSDPSKGECAGAFGKRNYLTTITGGMHSMFVEMWKLDSPGLRSAWKMSMV